MLMFFVFDIFDNNGGSKPEQPLNAGNFNCR